MYRLCYNFDKFKRTSSVRHNLDHEFVLTLHCQHCRFSSKCLQITSSCQTHAPKNHAPVLATALVEEHCWSCSTNLICCRNSLSPSHSASHFAGHEIGQRRYGGTMPSTTKPSTTGGCGVISAVYVVAPIFMCIRTGCAWPQWPQPVHT